MNVVNSINTTGISIDGSPSGGKLSFNMLHFMRFLNDNNVFAISIAAVLSERISEIINTCIDSVVMPIINRDADDDGMRDIIKLEEQTVTVFKIKISVGKLIVAIIKFVIVTYIVFIVAKLMKNIGKKFNFPEKNTKNPEKLYK